MSTGTDPLIHASPGSSDERSVSEVLASLIAGAQALVKKEFELARLELKKTLVEKAIALGLVMLGAVLGLFILAFVGVTAATALQEVVAPWVAWAIVTGIYSLLAAITVAIALVFARRSITPQRTKASLEETAAWAKRQVQR